MRRIDRLISNLKERLDKPLPGLDAQLIMASRKRMKFPFNTVEPLKAIPSGVLVLLYPSGNDIFFVLIRRPDYSGIHARQIGLPGGKFEKSDRSLTETAIREAREEIGIDPAKINVIGNLTILYIPPSNFIVTPTVAWSSERPEFTRDPREVDEIIEINLESFLDDTSVRVKRIKLFPGLSSNFPCYYIDKNIIWGATAMILSEFRVILKEIT
jgi:8-oxo-dGTP pyrophosphatase MutT (NUDIX family)